ncbi:MAG: hypothetical protein LBN74_04395 [Prevotella sp.]|jgi:hypothetical protein|nr:hypothetical protein [Prevotella sp.]
MSFFGGIWNGIKAGVKTVGKVAGATVKTVAKVATPLVTKIPIVGDIYGAATKLVGIDPVSLIGNSLGAVVSGGNIGKELASGFKDSQTGGILGILHDSGKDVGDSIPEYSTDAPGIYTYSDGSYAYTVGVDGKVTYQPSDMSSQQLVAETPNGSLIPIPSSLAAKQAYIQQLLNSYGNPFGVDLAGSSMLAMTNFVSGVEPLSGEQQSNILALDVVNQSPEALAYTAEALAQTTGKNAVDWVAILTGLWNTAKEANIPGVSNWVQNAESKAVDAAMAVAGETVTQKIARFLKDYGFIILGGVAVVTVVVLVSKKR